MQAHGSDLLGRDFRGALRANKLGPNKVPLRWAQMPAAHLTTSQGFDADSLFGRHVTPTGQALIEIRIAEAMGCRQCAPPLSGNEGRKRVAHAAYLSDSLERVQAIRYGISPSEPLEFAAMETRSERRYRKLVWLCEQHGGYAKVAAEAGVNPATLDQILKKVPLPPKKDGTRSPRSLGDPVARAIEDAYKLGRGWFDSDALAQAAPTRNAVAIGADAVLQDDEHELLTAYRLAASEAKADIRAKAIQLALDANPGIAQMMAMAGVSRRADDTAVLEWWHGVQSRTPRREQLLNKPSPAAMPGKDDSV